MQFDISLLEVLTLLSGSVLPLVVGLVTTRVTSAGTRAVLLLALSGAAGVLGEVIDSLHNNTDFNLGQLLILAFGTFLIGVGTHFGFYKPTGIAGKAISVGSK